MKFKHTPTREDGGGTLEVTAETPSEILEVISHFRILDKDKPKDVMELAKILSHGPPFGTIRESEKRPWFRVEDSLPRTFLEPYLRLLYSCTRWQGPFPDMELTHRHPRRLGYTHITDSLHVKDGVLRFVVFQNAEDWYGKKADVRAQENALDYVAEDVGFRPFEQKYIHSKTGSIINNPNYLERHKAKPGHSAPWIWDALFSWWRQNHASARQREILDACDSLRKGLNLEPDYAIRKSGQDEAWLVNCSGLYYTDENGTIDWDGKGGKASFIKWEAFAKL